MGDIREGEQNTIKGLLSWKKRRKVVHVPTVYDKKNLVSRTLSNNEFFEAMDIPPKVYANLRHMNSESISKIPIPVKVLYWALQKATKFFITKLTRTL